MYARARFVTWANYVGFDGLAFILLAATSLGIHAQTSGEAGTRIYVLVACNLALLAASLYALIYSRLRHATHSDEAEAARVLEAVHDLRGPLTAIQARAQLALRTAPSQRDALEKILESTSRLEGLLEEMCEPVEDVSHSQVRVGDVLSSALVGHTDAKHPVTLKGEGVDAFVNANAVQLRKLFANIVANAVKYSPQGCPITITVTQDESNVRIDVRDGGLGMSYDTMAVAFERGARGENTGGIAGTGLGLYMCKRIVKKAKGRIWLDSRLGQGTVVHVVLPLR